MRWFKHAKRGYGPHDHDVAILRRILGDTQVLTHPELPHAIFRAEERVAEQIDPWQA